MSIVSRFLELRGDAAAFQELMAAGTSGKADTGKEMDVANVPIPRPHCIGRREVPGTELIRYFSLLLEAHPAARVVGDRRGLAEYLSKGVLEKYGDPSEVLWCSAQAVIHRNRSHVPWLAQCPAGHFTDEALESNQVVGWVCEQCRKVYDAKECRLVPRHNT